MSKWVQGFCRAFLYIVLGYYLWKDHQSASLMVFYICVSMFAEFVSFALSTLLDGQKMLLDENTEAYLSSIDGKLKSAKKEGLVK